MQKAGAKLTAKLKIALYERAQKNKGVLAATQGQTSAMKLHYFRSVCMKSKMWVVTPGEEDEMTDVTDPSLVSTGCCDKSLATIFTTTVFQWLAKIVSGGEADADELELHIDVCCSTFEVPEDADLPDECSKALDNSQQALAASRAVAAEAIHSGTDLDAFDYISTLESEGLRTTGDQTPMSIIGMSMLAQPFWNQKVKKLLKIMDTLQAEAPLNKKRHKEVRSFGKEVKMTSVTQMVVIAEEVAYWDAAFPTLPVCTMLKSDLIAQAEQHVKQLTAVGADSAQLQINIDDRVILVHEYQKLYKKLNKIAPVDTRVVHSTGALRASVAAMDEGVKNAMLSSSIRHWSPDGDEPTLKVKDALAALSGKALASDTAASVSALWMDVYTSLSLPASDKFLVDPNPNKFTILQSLANSLPEKEKADKLVLAEFLNSAWRTKSLSVDLMKMAELKIDDPDYFAVTIETKDKACRDLLQASQRLGVACSDASNIAASKVSDASHKIEGILGAAKKLIQKVGNNIREVMETEMNEQVQELNSVFIEDEQRQKFEGKMNDCEDLNELMVFFDGGWKGARYEDMLAKCVEVETKMKALSSKTLEFGLFKGPNMYDEQEEQVKTCRAAACTYEIMNIVSDKTIKGDKTAMRKKMRSVQSDLKSFQVKPSDIKSECIVHAYNNVLKMKAFDSA